MRHTSQDMTVTSPTGHRRSSSSSCSTGSRIPGPPQTSPRSNVQQWLDALDTPAPPPPTSVALPSQPVSMCSAVTSSMPLGYSASQMAPQRVRSSRHSHTSRRSRFSTTSATVIQGMMDFSSQMTNNLAHLSEGVRVDAAHGEDATSPWPVSNVIASKLSNERGHNGRKLWNGTSCRNRRPLNGRGC